MLEQFHFIYPLWLLALIPLALLAWSVYRPRGGDNPWRRIVDARLLPLLMVGRARTVNRTALWLLAAGWIIAILALANPTWERKPQPVYQTTAATVVVLDLARSMDATDLKPSRLVRARYKVEDVLARNAEGQTGLVVYSGDAFTVSPLTRDVNTIRALLAVLDPGLMPTQGSRADLGLLRAGELLRQAGVSSGQILLIADGVDADKVAASKRAAARLKDEGYRVSVLGVGTADGAPPSDAQGELVGDAAGKIGHSGLDRAALQSLARAGGGEYRTITDTGEGLRALLRDRQPSHAVAATQTDATAQGWKEQGPLLALLLLPLAALAFRRNWLFGVALLVGVASSPQTAMALTWGDLWQRPDQQAAKALDSGDYVRASRLATDADRRGSAEYKRGNYQLALDNFAHATGADADYNRGNALAKLGQYEAAIAAYDKSLKEKPDDEDARANKAAVEALLKQQQQAQQQQASGSQRDGSQKDQNQGSGGGQNSSQTKAEASKDGKSGQSGASSGQGQQSANAKNPDGGAQSTGSTHGNGKDNASQGAPSDRGNDQQQQGNDTQSKDANAGKGRDQQQQGKDNPTQNAASVNGNDQQEATTSGTAQQKKSDNQFAQAARKLAEQRVGAAQADEGQSSQAASGGRAATEVQATANAAQHPQSGPADSAQPLDSEEQIAAEQWLRRIPDDPGGLLRRKFLYQYRQRAQHADTDSE